MKFRERVAFPAVLLLFFASGFSALLYQVIWQRMLGCFAGVDVYSVTITVAAFMGGLGCGSAAGGHLADHLSPRARLIVFCAAEALIAVFALLSKWLYYDLLYLRWSGFGNAPLLLPIVLFASLLIPTFCMGLTLPILAKTFTVKVESAPLVIGYLYGLNTLGAAIGAFTTIWLFLRSSGFEEILRIGAALNGISALGAGVVWWALSSSGSKELPSLSSSNPGKAEAARFPIALWMLIYGLSGFVALSLEIIWFRIFGVLQKSTAFTFGNLLGIFLLGLALGVIAGVPISRRSRHPTLVFLALQAAIPLYAAGTLSLLIWRLDRRGLGSLWAYLNGYEPVNPAELIAYFPGWLIAGKLPPELATMQIFGLIYFLIPLLLIAPATFLMGVSFPLLQRAVQVSPELLGRRLGWLQTLNICGSLLGATVVGWGALRFIGTAETLRLLVLLGGIFALLLAWRISSTRKRRVAALAIAIVGLAGVAGLVPSQKNLWARLHGSDPDRIVFAESDAGLALLRYINVGRPDEAVMVFINGLGQSWLPYGSIHTQIGMLGAMLHPKPEDVAVIGLGSGDTVFALGGSPHTREVTCVEIVRSVYDSLSALSPAFQYPALQTLLDDGRMRWLFTDARTYLQRTEKFFDIIEADALRPNSAYSGNLYSEQYFRMIKSKLKPGGLALSWAPTDRVLQTFLHVFPHAIVINGVAVGSEQAIETDAETVAGRLADSFTVAHYAKIGADVRPLLDAIGSGQFDRYGPEAVRGSATKLNSDLFPRDEFSVP